MHGHPCCPGESSCTNRSATLSLPIDGAGGVARAGPPAAAALRATCGSIGTWQKGRNGRPAYAIATSFSSMKYPVRSYGRPAYSSALAGALRRRHGCASDDNVRTRNATLHSRRRVGFLTLIQSAGPIDTAGRSAWRRYLRGSWRTHSETMPHHLRYQCGRTPRPAPRNRLTNVDETQHSTQDAPQCRIWDANDPESCTDYQTKRRVQSDLEQKQPAQTPRSIIKRRRGFLEIMRTGQLDKAITQILAL